MPEDGGKQNPEVSCLNKYQMHIACSYEYKIISVGDKFSKPFKTYLGKDTVIFLIIGANVAMTCWKSILTKNFWWINKKLKILRALQNFRSVTMIMLIIMLK